MYCLGILDFPRANKDLVIMYYRDLDQLATKIEEAAGRIEKKRSGGSEFSRVNKTRKQLSVLHAREDMDSYGRCGRPTMTEGGPLLQLSELYFEIATGNKTSSLKK